MVKSKAGPPAGQLGQPGQLNYYSKKSEINHKSTNNKFKIRKQKNEERYGKMEIVSLHHG